MHSERRACWSLALLLVTGAGCSVGGKLAAAPPLPVPPSPGAPALALLAGTPGESRNADDAGRNLRLGERLESRPITVAGDALYVTDLNHTVRGIDIAPGRARTLGGVAGVNGSADGV
jgi:hypothetical protein